MNVKIYTDGVYSNGGHSDMRTYFEKIAGNTNTKSHIGRAISEGTLPHALMITGDEGSGKLLLAKEIAAAVNCTNRDSSVHALPCGVCNNCRRIRSEQFLDLHIFRKNEDKASIGIEEIRVFLNDVTMSGAESDYRFYIFDNAELMTPQTQNSLLKVLEEPPVGVYIILLCERPDNILTTIKSRVQTVAMSRFDIDELDKYLTANSSEAQILKRLDKTGYLDALTDANGCIGRALSMMNRETLDNLKSKNEFTKRLIHAFSPRTKYLDLREVMRLLPSKKQALDAELDRAIDGVNDLISVGYDRKKPRTLFKTEEEALSLLREIGIDRLIRIYGLITEMKDGLSKNANPGMLITKMTAELSCR